MDRYERNLALREDAPTEAELETLADLMADEAERRWELAGDR